MRCAAIVALLAATGASAAEFAVSVGASGLVYDPTSVNAKVGDVVTFTFSPKNHTVTQSTFANPCTKASPSAIDSGFEPVAAGAATQPTFTIIVNSTDPLWFYCRQTGHCAQGMVFAINPTADKTFAQFQNNAKSSGSSSSGSSSSTSSGSGSGGYGGAGTGSTTGSSTSTGASPSSSAKNGAVNVNSNVAGLLALVGLVAGSVF